MKKIQVTVRTKTISGGKKSLYLNFYPAITNPQTGLETRREFLKLYIYEKPKGFTEKLNNSENLRMAEMICTQSKNAAGKYKLSGELISGYPKNLWIVCWN